MTFQQFQDTRREATIAEMEEVAGFQADDCTGGFIYVKDLYLVRIDHKNGKYFLILERDEWISDNLEDLERKLYQWGIEAGAITPNFLHLKATDELRRVLDNTDIAYDDEGDVLHMVLDDPQETLRALREMVDVEEVGGIQ